MFEQSTVHLKTNHSIGEYVDSTNPMNTLNDLENQNKLLKRRIVCRRTTKLLRQYMALFYYRQDHVEKLYKQDLGFQIQQFLEDIKKVYPGFVNGVKLEGLTLRAVDPPTVESEDLGDLIPAKRPKLSTITEEIDEADDEDSENNNGDEDYVEDTF